MHKYNPTPTDIKWAKHSLDMIAEGGVFVLQDVLLIYNVNKKEKVLTLQNPDFLLDEVPRDTHERTKAVFGKLGYKVTERHSC